MKAKNETAALDEMIFALEQKRAAELNILKEQFHVTIESFRPSNLIKNTFHELTSSSGIKNNLISNVIGIGTGLLSRKLLIGGSSNPIKKLLGTIAQLAITNVVSRNSDNIKSTGGSFLQRLFKSRKENKNGMGVIELDNVKESEVN